MENINSITPSELSNLLDSSTTFDRILLVDCRPFTSFNAGHISGAHNVHCPPIVRRRSGGCIPFVNVIRSPEARDALDKGAIDMIVVYDEKGGDVEKLAHDSDMKLTLDAILKKRANAVLRFLKGGFEQFVASCRNHCAFPTDITAADSDRQEYAGISVTSTNTPRDSYLTSFVCSITNRPSALERVDCGAESKLNERCGRDEGDPVEIKPWLYLGSRSHASRRQRLGEMGITALLNVATDCIATPSDTATTTVPSSALVPGSSSSSSFATRLSGRTSTVDSRAASSAAYVGPITCMCLAICDNATADISCWFSQCIQFIESIRRAGGKVLVHCEAGISRSATMCIAYLMQTNGLTMDDAYDYVKFRRSIIAPNLNFMRQLSEFEGQLCERRRNRARSATLTSSGDRNRLRPKSNLWTPIPTFDSPPSRSSFLFDVPSQYRLNKSTSNALRRISLSSTRCPAVLQQSIQTTQLSPPGVCYEIIAADRSLRRTLERGCNSFDLSNVVSSSTSVHGPLIISSQ